MLSDRKVHSVSAHSPEPVKISFKRIENRKCLQDETQSRPAFRHPFRRQVLQPYLPCCNRGARQCTNQRQSVVDTGYRTMNKAHKADESDAQVSDPLQNTQRAGVQILDVLQVVAEPKQQQASQGNK